MWGNGGRFYWGRSESGVESKGIVVLFAWLSSEEKNLRPYIDLYGSLGWNSLICHVDFLTLFLPEKASSLATGVLNELVKEVSIRPLPIVLTSFSGGSKGCLYKLLQLVEGKCEGQLFKDKYKLVRDCICGQIYDSSPVDFTSDLGARFVLHPSVLKLSHPPRLVSWVARGLASGLDALFLDRFEAQRAEYWQTLYSSVRFGPFLIFCSEDDDLAPYHVVCNFAQRLQEQRGDVKLVKWDSSPHVAHYKHHRAEYKAAVVEFLTRVSGEPMASEGSCSDFHRAAIGSSDDFLLLSSMEFNEGREVEEDRALVNPHGVLSQILYDVCVPENVEGWDIKPGVTLSGRRGFGPFNPMRFIRRSRL